MHLAGRRLLLASGKEWPRGLNTMNFEGVK